MKQPRLPVWRHALYRIWCNRLLVVFVPLLVTLAACLAGWVGGLHSYYFMPEAILQTGVIALVAILVTVVIFPSTGPEILVFTVVIAAMVATEPWQDALFAPGHKGGAFPPYWTQALAFFSVGMCASGMLLVLLQKLTNALPAPTRPMRYRYFVPGTSPEILQDLMRLKPDSTSGLVRHGPRQWDGWVPSTMHLRGHDPKSLAIIDDVVKYRVREVSDTPGHARYAVQNTTEDTPRMLDTWYNPHRGGTMIEIVETPASPDRLANWTVQLSDLGQDLTRARVDAALGRPSLSILGSPQRSITATVMRPVYRLIRGRGPSTPAETP